VPRIDRACADDARFVVERLIPDAEARKWWLGVLADAMVSAHGVHPGSWGITLFHDKLRMNVGTIEVAVLRIRRAMLVVDASDFSDDELHHIRLNPELGAVDQYTSVRGTANLLLPYDTAADDLAGTRKAHLALVVRAASMVRTRTNYARAHSIGVEEYVAQVTGRTLPQADYRW
jgi:hypothetical protein